MIIANLRRWTFPLSLLFILGLLLGSTGENNILPQQGWGMLSAEIVTIALAALYWGFEQDRVSSRELAIIAVLGTMAAVGRVAFTFLPNVQPTTFMIIISGFVFGPRAGFMVGSTAALVSNFFLGQGPWTPWQMFSWGLAGSSAGVLAQIFPRIGHKSMAVFGFVWGYLYGWIMNFWFWTVFVHPLNWQSFVATYAASLWFDTFRAVGTAGFCLFFGSSYIKILKRFRRKLEVTAVSSPHPKSAACNGC